MNIKVNGKDIALENEITIQELLVLQNVKTPQYVTVQLNEQLIDQKDFSQISVQDKDEIEFLYFMGGGRFKAEG